MSELATKENIQDFWKSLYDSLYENVDQNLTRDRLFESLNDLEDMFRLR